MNIPQIQIQTTKGQLQIQTTKPRQEIVQPKATLTQQHPAAIVEMSSKRSKLTIDTTEARAEIDLKSVRRRIEEYAQKGKQAALEGIGRRAAEGKQMMNIQNGGGNVFAQLAKQNTTGGYRSLALGFIGNKSGVKTAFQPGSVDIRITPQKATTQVQKSEAIHEYTPGNVSISLQPKPSIQIDVKR